MSRSIPRMADGDEAKVLLKRIRDEAVASTNKNKIPDKKEVMKELCKRDMNDVAEEIDLLDEGEWIDFINHL